MAARPWAATDGGASCRASPPPPFHQSTIHNSPSVSQSFKSDDERRTWVVRSIKSSTFVCYSTGVKQFLLYLNWKLFSSVIFHRTHFSPRLEYMLWGLSRIGVSASGSCLLIQCMYVNHWNLLGEREREKKRPGVKKTQNLSLSHTPLVGIRSFFFRVFSVTV